MGRPAESEAAMADDLTQRILSSAKYRNLDETVVCRVATEAVRRFRDRSQRIKYAKRRLHQAFGAFLTGSPAEAVTAMVTAVRSGQADLRSAARSAMTAHASSAERAGWLEPFYDQVARWCGTPCSVADLACGLNPLAIPWMRLSPDATYWACEIDTALVAALAGLDEIMPVRFTAATRDLVASSPVVRADVALMLKTVTTIEQQEAGSAGRLLSALDCRHVVLSLPRRSLSGRRGYSGDADAIVAEVVAGSRYRVSAEASFGTEILYHLTPKAGERGAPASR
jgi:16S rRNA (guanine(1405)-N(7))-methyltransferase